MPVRRTSPPYDGAISRDCGPEHEVPTAGGRHRGGQTMEEPGAGVQEPVGSGSGVTVAGPTRALPDGRLRRCRPPLGGSPRCRPSSVVPVWRPVVASSEAVRTPEPRAAGRRPGGWPWVVVATAAALVGAVVGGSIVAVTQHRGSVTHGQGDLRRAGAAQRHHQHRGGDRQGASGHRLHRRQVAGSCPGVHCSVGAPFRTSRGPA